MAGSIKSLSSYALRCGCVGKKRIGDTEVVIEHESCFQVHAHDYEEHQQVMWQGYKTVSAARKAFNLVVRGLRMYYHKKPDRLVLSEEIESYV